MAQMNELEKYKALAVIAQNAGADEELVKWVNHKAEQAEAKAEKRSAKNDEKVQARRVTAEKVVAYMTANPGKYTATELANKVPNIVPDGGICTSSQMTSYLTLLKDDGRVVNTKEKGKSLYTIA